MISTTIVGTGSTAVVFNASPEYESYLLRRGDDTINHSHVVKCIYDIYAPIQNEIQLLEEQLKDVPHILPLVHWIVQLRHSKTGILYAIDSHRSSMYIPYSETVELVGSTSFSYFKPIVQPYKLIHRDRISPLDQLRELDPEEYHCIGALLTFPAMDLNLDEWVKGLSNEPSPLRVQAFDQLSCAVQNLHAKGVYHGDLHAKNVLIKQGKRIEDMYIVLIDFGKSEVDLTDFRRIERLHLACLLYYILMGTRPKHPFMLKIDMKIYLDDVRETYKLDRLVVHLCSLIEDQQ